MPCPGRTRGGTSDNQLRAGSADFPGPPGVDGTGEVWAVGHVWVVDPVAEVGPVWIMGPVSEPVPTSVLPDSYSHPPLFSGDLPFLNLHQGPHVCPLSTPGTRGRPDYLLGAKPIPNFLRVP